MGLGLGLKLGLRWWVRVRVFVLGLGIGLARQLEAHHGGALQRGPRSSAQGEGRAHEERLWQVEPL